MYGMPAANGLGAGSPQAERAHLAVLDELRHGADRVLDRHARIDAVLIIDIDHLHAHALEARLAGTDDKFRTAVGEFAVAAADIAELRRQHHVRAAPLNG